MDKNKKFDCIRMKRDIQKGILKEYESKSDKEARKLQMDEILKNPVLGPFCRKLHSIRKTSSTNG